MRRFYRQRQGQGRLEPAEGKGARQQHQEAAQRDSEADTPSAELGLADLCRGIIDRQSEHEADNLESQAPVEQPSDGGQGRRQAQHEQHSRQHPIERGQLARRFVLGIVRKEGQLQPLSRPAIDYIGPGKGDQILAVAGRSGEPSEQRHGGEVQCCGHDLPADIEDDVTLDDEGVFDALGNWTSARRS